MGIKNSRYTLIEDELLINKPAEIWVDAHVGTSSCQSNKTSVILEHTGAAGLHHFSTRKGAEKRMSVNETCDFALQ